MNAKQLAKENSLRVKWHPRYPLGKWVYFDVVKGPAVVRAYLPSGYLLTIMGSHLAMYGMPHQVHEWSKSVAKKWSRK